MGKRVHLGFALVLIVLAAIGVISYRSTSALIESSRWVARTHEVLAQLEGTLSTLNNAEAGAQGYAFTGDDTFLERTYPALTRLNDRLRSLEELAKDDPRRAESLRGMRTNLEDAHHLLSQVIETRRRTGVEAAQELLATERYRGTLERARQDVRNLLDTERNLLASRAGELNTTARSTLINVLLFTVLTVSLLLAAYFTMRKDIGARFQAEQQAEEARRKLTEWVSELERRTREITLLSQMGDMLQTCNTLEEASAVIADFAQKLFPTEPGGIYVLAPSGNLVEEMAVWGADSIGEGVFAPDECWALRGGRVHLVNDPQASLLCNHVKDNPAAAYLCVPMMAQGEALGILHLQKPTATPGADPVEYLLSESDQRLAVTLGENVALALANLRLRETLRMQSIRDPLTGLFNRRYLEESLEREIRRAARSGGTVGVLMLDIDHFKRFNDDYGHEGGDLVLRELGNFLRKRTRGEDIACRYGGEEFIVVLPGATAEVSRQRAEQIREEAKHLDLLHRGQPLGSITVSVGVAMFPQDGATLELLLRSADEALYAAKSAGRDQVAPPPSPTRS